MQEDNKKPGRAKSDTPWTFKKWYLDNKEAVAQRRKERYRSDPSYKARVLEQNKKHRQSKIEAKHITVGGLAKMIGKTSSIITGWQRTGTLPKTPYLAEHGSRTVRLYTEDMAKAVKEVVDSRFGQVISGDSSFRLDVIQRWKQLGVSCEE